MDNPRPPTAPSSSRRVAARYAEVVTACIAPVERVRHLTQRPSHGVRRPSHRKRGPSAGDVGYIGEADRENLPDMGDDGEEEADDQRVLRAAGRGSSADSAFAFASATTTVGGAERLRRIARRYGAARSGATVELKRLVGITCVPVAETP